MKRVRGLSNENYAERKDYISRTLKALYDGYAVDPIPTALIDTLDRMPR